MNNPLTTTLSVDVADLSGPEYVLVLSKADNPELFPFVKELMGNSAVCRRMAKFFTREELSAIVQSELIQDKQWVVIFDEPGMYFTDGQITTINDFYEYILFAQRYFLDLSYICNKSDFLVWLAIDSMTAKDMWVNNSLIVEPIEQKSFMKPKLMSAAGAGNYPTTSKKPMSGLLRETPRRIILEPEKLMELISILAANGQTKFVMRLIALYGTGIDTYESIFNAPMISTIYNLPIFSEVMWYVFRILYLKELAAYARKHDPNSTIIDYSLLQHLPNEPPLDERYHLPYFPCCAPRMSTKLSLPLFIEGPRGIYDIQTVKNRINYMTGGMLKYINWNIEGKAKSVLTGSTIAACVIINPLESYFRELEDYFAEYYPKRMSNVPIVNTKESSRMKFIQLSESEDSSDDDQQTDLKFSGSAREYLRNNRKTDSDDDSDQDDGKGKDTGSGDDDSDTTDTLNHKIDYTDIDIMVECDWNDFDDVALDHFNSISRAASEQGISVVLNKIITENKHKYEITGLGRTIDIFHVIDIPSVMVKYHLGCVRAWYDGTTIKCFPSFVTAAFTGINVDIRWTSNKKDVKDIVLKYMQRGFCTLLNKTDVATMKNYINNGSWGNINAPPNHVWRVRRFWRKAYFHATPGFFHPSKTRLGIHKDLSTKTTNMRRIKFKDNKFQYRGLDEIEQRTIPHLNKHFAEFL